MSEKIYIMKPFTGNLFKNKNRKSDKSPEYTGTIKLKEDEFFISGWVKISKKGEKYFSFALQEKKPVYSKSQNTYKQEPQYNNEEEEENYDEPIPF